MSFLSSYGGLKAVAFSLVGPWRQLCTLTGNRPTFNSWQVCQHLSVQLKISPQYFSLTSFDFFRLVLTSFLTCFNSLLLCWTYFKLVQFVSTFIIFFPFLFTFIYNTHFTNVLRFLAKHQNFHF